MNNVYSNLTHDNEMDIFLSEKMVLVRSTYRNIKVLKDGVQKVW